VTAADFTPERIAELRALGNEGTSVHTLDGYEMVAKVTGEWFAMLDAIEELQVALLATIKLTPVVQPKTEADLTPEKLAEIAAGLMGR
jgi:hypothetical protein